MSSPDLEAPAAPHPRGRVVLRLLDGAFGLFVWAFHLLAIYVAAAVACVLGIGSAAADVRTAFWVALALLTVAAIVVVVLHALHRYRNQRNVAEQRFRMSMTIGCDGIATLAIAAQLVPLLLVPLCA